MLQSLYHLCGPSLGSPELGTVLQVCPHCTEQRGRITSHDLLAMAFLRQLRMLLAFFVTWNWLMVNLLSIWTVRSFSARLLSCQSGPSICWCMEFFFLRNRVCSLFNLMMFLSAHLSSLLWSLWMAACSSGLSITPVLYHQCICWGCTLSHRLGHEWRC